MSYVKGLTRSWLREMYIVNNEDFDDFCRRLYGQVQNTYSEHGSFYTKSFEDFVEENYQTLYKEYINSMDKTIH